jgi:hypothetical protein
MLWKKHQFHRARPSDGFHQPDRDEVLMKQYRSIVPATSINRMRSASNGF